MKITALNAATQSLDRIREKKDAEGQNRDQHQQNLSQHQKKKEEEDAPADAEKVGAAIDSFAAELQNQTAGLSASMSGQGPGLKVVLKDGSGAVIRQLTGEEFLKLREAATQGSSRGKLLDQKL